MFWKKKEPKEEYSVTRLDDREYAAQVKYGQIARVLGMGMQTLDCLML